MRRRGRVRAMVPVAVLTAILAVGAAAGTARPGRVSDGSPATVTVEPVAVRLTYPAGFTFAPDGRIFYGEKNTGEIRIVDPATGSDTLFARVSGLSNQGEQGLLGVALHPDYPATRLVFVYATRITGGPVSPANQIIRITDDGGVGTNPRVIWQSDVKLADQHQGGRILFGPDRKLYAVEGNHTSDANSQNLSNTAGKMLRMGIRGNIPPDNPDPTSVIWAYGLRNSFGFAFDPVTSNLWETDPGPGCNDEINLIVKGGNYGHGPNGRCVPPFEENMNVDGPNPILPEASFTPVITPVGIAFCQACGLADSDGTMFFAGWNLPSQVYRVALSPDRTGIVSMESVYTHPHDIISMEVGPDHALYLSDGSGIYKLVSR